MIRLSPLSTLFPYTTLFRSPSVRGPLQHPRGDPGTGWRRRAGAADRLAVGASRRGDGVRGRGVVNDDPPPILIVEDDPTGRELLIRILTADGYEGVPAANAQEARQRLAEREFGAVLIDVRMPGESGIELLRHVRGRHPDVAAMMVTALDDPELMTTAFETGAYAYVVKPYRVNELLINLSNTLHRRQREIQNRSHVRELEVQVL